MAEQNRTQRLTPKAAFITDKVLFISGKKKGRNKIIENSLSKDYPLFAEIWENENKKVK